MFNVQPVPVGLHSYDRESQHRASIGQAQSVIRCHRIAVFSRHAKGGECTFKSFETHVLHIFVFRAFNRFNETHDGATWKLSRRKESIKKKAFTFYNESVSAKKTVVSLDHRYITIGIV
jgi:hypothetical protein